MSDFLDCPCCGFPTLNERAAFEMCPVCWWEDSPDAGAETLTQARENFADHFDMFNPGKGIGVVANPSPERKTLLVYLRGLQGGDHLDERKLHGLLRNWAQANKAGF